MIEGGVLTQEEDREGVRPSRQDEGPEGVEHVVRTQELEVAYDTQLCGHHDHPQDHGEQEPFRREVVEGEPETREGRHVEAEEGGGRRHEEAVPQSPKDVEILPLPFAPQATNFFARELPGTTL